MLLKLPISELKIKPATSPHPPLPTISQLTYTAQQVGGLLKWVGARGHSIAERNGFSVHRHEFKSWLCPRKFCELEQIMGSAELLLSYQ